MRTAFICREEIEAVQAEKKKGVYAALDVIAPWACKFVRVCGGYQAFENWTDYEIWRKQK